MTADKTSTTLKVGELLDLYNALADGLPSTHGHDENYMDELHLEAQQQYGYSFYRRDVHGEASGSGQYFAATDSVSTERIHSK